MYVGHAHAIMFPVGVCTASCSLLLACTQQCGHAKITPASLHLSTSVSEVSENHGTEAMDSSRSRTDIKGALLWVMHLRLKLAVMRPCIHVHVTTFHFDFPWQQKIACFSLCLPLTRSHTSFTHIITTACTRTYCACARSHNSSFMHQHVHAWGINCIYVTLVLMLLHQYHIMRLLSHSSMQN